MRNCPKPLRTDDFADSRDFTAPPRCPVLGVLSDGSPDPRHDAEFRRRFWRALDWADVVERGDPSTIPADQYEWSRIVVAEYRAAVQRWRKIHAHFDRGGVSDDRRTGSHKRR